MSRDTEMAVDGASGVAAGVGAGMKAGVFVALAAGLVSAIAVTLGFTAVPLDATDPTRDAGRRIACGLLTSFTLGFPLAFKAIDMFPWLLTPWATILADWPPAMVYLAGASPFLALTAVPGFWIVVAFMKWFTNRSGKDVGELVQDARNMVKGNDDAAQG